MNKYIINIIVSLLFVFSITGCTREKKDAQPLHRPVSIIPDYADVTIPKNIAPLRFCLPDSITLDDALAVFVSAEKTVCVENDTEDGFCISESDWNTLINASDTIEVLIQGMRNGKCVEYDPFHIYVSGDKIDTYLTYRLIEPGYEVWNKMGIYQRNIENYEEEEILSNEDTNGGCMNCHSFRNHSSEKMLFHLRVDYSGSYILEDGKINKLVQDANMPNYVYPSWHPGGRFIAFSQNKTKQMFHTTDANRIEVFDYSSDIVIYDTETNNVFTTPELHSSDSFETFPSWSPDGKKLYFCSADSVCIPDDYDKVKYSICSIDFNPSTQQFSDKVDTIVNAHENGKTAVFPKVSPNGRYLMYTQADYGNFTIWHKESKLCTIYLATEAKDSMNIRASYHSWDSSSRWVVCSSRSDDGLYTRPYIFHIDEKGKCTKPFALPQPDGKYYVRLMKSFNIPEFTKDKTKIPNLKSELQKAL